MNELSSKRFSLANGPQLNIKKRLTMLFSTQIFVFFARKCHFSLKQDHLFKHIQQDLFCPQHKPKQKFFIILVIFLIKFSFDFLNFKLKKKFTYESFTRQDHLFNVMCFRLISVSNVYLPFEITILKSRLHLYPFDFINIRAKSVHKNRLKKHSFDYIADERRTKTQFLFFFLLIFINNNSSH